MAVSIEPPKSMGLVLAVPEVYRKYNEMLHQMWKCNDVASSDAKV